MKEGKNKSLYIMLIILAVLLLGGAFLFFSGRETTDENYDPDTQEFISAETLPPGSTFPSLSAIKTIPDSEIQETSDGTKYTIDPKKIRGGGPPKGGIGVDRGIPALSTHNIKYVSVQDADQWIQDNELVLAIEHNGVERVYPLQIMTWHEIANDVIGGDPIAITYCPLCGSGIAYYRVLDGKPVQFGTSGKLFNSNLVMYDDLTETYWQQIDGDAIVGELTGFELKELSVDTVVWRDWKKEHPNSQILSRETGISRNYGRDPYGSYYEDSFLIFGVDNEDDRVHPKTPVVGIEVNGAFQAYRESDLKETPVIEDSVGGVSIKVERMDDGKIIITNQDTGEEIVKERDFWFAWYAFHPDTDLYGVPPS